MLASMMSFTESVQHKLGNYGGSASLACLKMWRDNSLPTHGDLLNLCSVPFLHPKFYNLVKISCYPRKVPMEKGPLSMHDRQQVKNHKLKEKRFMSLNKGKVC